jgi:hypothetical protein
MVFFHIGQAPGQALGQVAPGFSRRIRRLRGVLGMVLGVIQWVIGSSNTASVPVRNTANSSHDTHSPHQVCSQAWAWRKLPRPTPLVEGDLAISAPCPGTGANPADQHQQCHGGQQHTQTRASDTGENAQIAATT